MRLYARFCLILFLAFLPHPRASVQAIEPTQRLFLPIVRVFPPTPLHFRNVTYTYTNAPGVAIWGELFNTTSERLYEPIVQGVAGTGPITSQERKVPGVIEPHDTVAFYLYLFDATPTTTLYLTPTFTIEQAAAPTAITWEWLTLTTSQFVSSSLITGTLRNDYPAMLVWCGGTITLYDANNHVIGIEFITFEQNSPRIQEGHGYTINPGVAVHFSARIPHTLPIARYRIQASGTAIECITDPTLCTQSGIRGERILR